MEPVVDLAPGAEDNALAVELALAVKSGLGHRRKLSSFRALRGAVLLVAQDTGDSLTMRFDLGRLTVHDGMVGIPTVTFCGDAEVLRRLRDARVSRFLRLPASARLMKLVANGDLTIYGLLAHPRMIVRFLRLLAAPGDS